MGVCKMILFGIVAMGNDWRLITNLRQRLPVACEARPFVSVSIFQPRSPNAIF